ncbi:MAG TPA: hypothetical protein VFY23_06155 [Candidatus Limnocylindrales bacterium]|nr:hypothetical protein [Candidatus Limnocylindrales bacterium]
MHRAAAHPRPAHARPLVLALAAVLAAAGCGTGGAPATPPITPGAIAAPRDVNIVMRDYAYVPPIVDLVPGETVTFRVLNGGLEIHEAILGDLETQLAWEDAEAAVADHPPGPTPTVDEPPGFDGVRIVVESGKRLDVTWTVPEDAASAEGGWFVGCHIPGHWQKGMVVPVRFVGPGGVPLGTPPPLPGTSPGSSPAATQGPAASASPGG